MSGFLPSVFLFLTLCTGLVPCRAAGKEAGSGPRPPILDARYAPARPDLPEGELSSDRILDVFFPSCPPPRGGYPVVVFIHGGGFKNGDKSTSGSIGPIRDSLLSHGFVFVSANYYLTLHFHDKGVSCGSEMRNGFPESGVFDPSIQRAIDDASEDVCLALKYLRSRRRELHLDMDRVALCGGSAGAITALNVAYVVKPRAPRVRAVVNCWGAISDVGKIGPGAPPALILHGSEDDLIHVVYGKEIHRRLLEVGSSASELYVMEGRGHAQYVHVGKHLMDTTVLPFLERVMNVKTRKKCR